MTEGQCGDDPYAGHGHQSPRSIISSRFLAHAIVESSLLLLDLLVDGQQSFDNRSQGICAPIDNSPRMSRTIRSTTRTSRAPMPEGRYGAGTVESWDPPQLGADRRSGRRHEQGNCSPRLGDGPAV